MRGASRLKLRAALVLSALLASGALIVLVGAAAGAAAAASPVPSGFVGMNADGPLFNDHVDLPHQLTKMASSGVQRVRVVFDWGAAQPYATCSQVPAGQAGQFAGCPGGVPTDFARTDEIVRLAAERHLRLLPVVMYSPSWDRSSKGSRIQPARDKPYGRYLNLLVGRYGPRGTYWTTHPSVPREPVTQWQIWNEPDLSYTWSTQPFAHSYVALLRVAHDAVKRADPHAMVVLASLTNYGWRDLASVYKLSGSRGLFDAVTADVYTAHPKGVITILNYYRQVMAAHGDRNKALVATEVGWPSDRGTASANPSFSTTEKGQATKLSRLLPLLAQNRGKLGLAGFFYYTWLTTDRGGPSRWYYYSGLLRFNPATNRISPKPAYFAFRRTVLKLES
ncbi:MAG TPA: hypothetical protein VE983_00255 [Solirubrobacteraceae bacterium]|nr:hypothetical protein [Solirubrobacteraceae bacterium]